MGPPTYSMRLRTGLDSLTPLQRNVRLAVDDYFAELQKSSRRELVIRFRRLGQFLRIGRERWPQAVDHLFSKGYGPAERTVSGFRKWVAHQESWSPNLKAKINPWGFLRISKTLKIRGVIPWELKHTRTRAREGRWASCARPFRIEVEAWLRLQRVRNLVPSTLLSLKAELLTFGGYLRMHRLAFERVTYSDALSWLEGVRDSGLSTSTLNHRLSVVKRFYAWLKARRIINETPFDTLQCIRRRYKLPRILEEPEVVRLIRSANSCRARAILEVLYASGCRAGELCKLDLNQVSFAEKTARTVGKGGHERVIYFNESAIKAIKAYLPTRQRILRKCGIADEKALFLTRQGTRLTLCSVIGMVKIASERARLGKHVHPHMLRHSFATHLLNRGADLFSIMQFLGHKNIQSTVRYLQVATARLSEVHRRFHPRR